MSLPLRHAIHLYLPRRCHRSLRPWINSPLEFRQALRDSKALIAGSVTLSIALQDSWTPRNLDIYTPMGQAKDAMVLYLTQCEKYSIKTVLIRRDKVSSLAPRSAHTITVLCKDSGPSHLSARVNVIESPTRQALIPILRGTATWTFNWLSADAIVVGYPALTFKHLGIIRPSPSAAEDTEARRWKQRYRGRGFIRITRSSWPWPGQACRFHCRAQWRHATDHGCLVFMFGEERYTEDVAWVLNDGTGRRRCTNPACPSYGLSAVQTLPNNLSISSTV